MAFRILFVCSGNTCRSPLAVAAWQAFTPALFSESGGNEFCGNGAPEIVVQSAGLSAIGGISASDHAVKVAHTWGTDLSTHRACCLTKDMARAADLICPMTAGQIFALREYFGVDAAKIRLLGSFVEDGEGKPDDEDQKGILDPFGGSFEAYETCGAHIRRAVLGLARALRDGKISVQ